MKKNMLTIIIVALCFINVVLTALVVFVVVPSTKRTDKFVKQVASVIELELEAEGQGELEKVGISDIEVYKIESELMINLKKNADESQSHFAAIDSLALSLNKDSKDYKKLSATLKENEVPITDIVNDVIAQYTFDEAPLSKSKMKAEVLKQIQEYYGSDFIISVSFGNIRFQ